MPRGASQSFAGSTRASKEQSQGSWGVYAYDAGTWTERPNIVAWVSRVHFARIAGTPRSLESTPVGDAIRLELESTIDAKHVAYIPERYAASTKVTCDGAAVDATRDPATGLVEISCTGIVDLGPASSSR